MSRRVLLISDDYVENSRTETLLKKVGFDVMAIGTDVGLADKVLSFRPDLVVASGNSAKVSALGVGAKLKEMRGFSGAVMLGIDRGAKMNPMDLLKVRMDRMLEVPFDAEKLVRNMCEILALDAEACLEKLRKAQWSESGGEAQMVRGAGVETASTLPEVSQNEAPVPSDRIKSRMTPEERRKRFEKAVGGLDINASDTTLKRASARDKWADVKKDWDLQKLDDQKELKKKFAEALFDEPSGTDDEGA
ncbi:MAG: hypothetical protein KF767_07860 [Bdellovibrionaceae bacterium]|nr:hypothetical protein [Pseudobdellovibrionaceae bacterium]